MINRILNLCIEAKEHGHDCFFQYTPHVEWAEVRIYVDGWRSGEEADKELRANFDKPKELEEIIEILEKLIQEGE